MHTERPTSVPPRLTASQDTRTSVRSAVLTAMDDATSQLRGRSGSETPAPTSPLLSAAHPAAPLARPMSVSTKP